MTIRIWDLPTRLFHWALLVCVCGAFITSKVGGNALEYHFWFGYAILSLLLFRLLWGFVGGYYSRFLNFPLRFSYLLAYLRGTTDQLPRPALLGHNPLGSLSVLALLAVLLFQAGSGLFANDDIASTGPLSVWISKDLSDALTELHKNNQVLILLLVTLHILAIAFYRWYKKQDLIRSMLTGDKSLDDQRPIPQKLPKSADTPVHRLLAVLLFSACVAIVYWLTHLRPA